MKKKLDLSLAAIKKECPYFLTLSIEDQKILREVLRCEKFGTGPEAKKLSKEQLRAVWRSAKHRRQNEKRISLLSLEDESGDLTLEIKTLEEQTNHNYHEDAVLDMLDLRGVCHSVRNKAMMTRT